MWLAAMVLCLVRNEVYHMFDDAGVKVNGVGGRISDLTGVCEVLSHSWGRNPTIEPGYGYVKNIYTRKNFEPEIEVENMALTIPGVLNIGAKLDIHFRWPKNEWKSDTISFQLIEALREEYSDTADYAKLLVSVDGTGGFSYIEQTENGASLGLTFSNVPGIVPSAECKITFVARKNFLQILVDDEVVNERSLEVVRLDYVRQVIIRKYTTGNTIKKNLLSLRRFEFTEA
ncbi:uncharacterized protein LOC128548999 isoform X2 [Mercenaria mercenaria]|uniref:uncharacterized protein LOC128548999 isoform X2 n=1 Tax=Mercenaria mercenaria TaxID=6596 RepID=UPI00234EF371|nr:uncharacterized protein LOC128548999 isoform X2 [Mercenaria mercenaria]